jgi:hypothetical protein
LQAVTVVKFKIKINREKQANNAFLALLTPHKMFLFHLSHSHMNNFLDWITIDENWRGNLQRKQLKLVENWIFHSSWPFVAKYLFVLMPKVKLYSFFVVVQLGKLNYVGLRSITIVALFFLKYIFLKIFSRIVTYQRTHKHTSQLWMRRKTMSYFPAAKMPLTQSCDFVGSWTHVMTNRTFQSR